MHAAMTSVDVPVSSSQVSVCPSSTIPLATTPDATFVHAWLCAVITWDAELLLFAISATRGRATHGVHSTPPCITATRSFSLAPDVGLLLPDLMHAGRPSCVVIRSVDAPANSHTSSSCIAPVRAVLCVGFNTGQVMVSALRSIHSTHSTHVGCAAHTPETGEEFSACLLYTSPSPRD